MSNWLTQRWYARHLHPVLWILLPLNWLFVLFSALRRLAFRCGLRKTTKPAVPLVVVGNISVGGTGKTPVVVRLATILQAAGFKPGIVSRGYGGQGPFPQRVAANSDPQMVGDEPCMLAQITGLPVAVAPHRSQAVELLLAECAVDVVISDDGLQHYAMGRDIEVAVVDAKRGLGNGWRLPVGPLRESKRRLAKVDWVIENGGSGAGFARGVGMQLDAVGWHSVATGNAIETPDGESVIAVAGIGHPARFFDILGPQGLHVVESRVFDDHHAYQPADFFDVSNQFPVVMTEKDAVKCRAFARPHWYYLKVGAIFDADFEQAFIERVQELSNDT